MFILHVYSEEIRISYIENKFLIVHRCGDGCLSNLSTGRKIPLLGCRMCAARETPKEGNPS